MNRRTIGPAASGSRLRDRASLDDAAASIAAGAGAPQATQGCAFRIGSENGISPGAALKIRPDAAEKRAQLACLPLWESHAVGRHRSFQVRSRMYSMIGRGLGGERQEMSAAIIRIRHALDVAGRLQPVEQTNERNRPDVENFERGAALN